MLKLVLALFIMTFVLKRFSSILHRMNKKLCEREGWKFLDATILGKVFDLDHESAKSLLH